MKKLPEVSNGKGDDACVKEKRLFSLTKGAKFLSLSGVDQRFDNIVAVVSGHHAYDFGRSDG